MDVLGRNPASRTRSSISAYVSGDVSGLQRQKLFLSLPAEAFFDHADKIKQSDRIVKPRILLLQ